MYVPMAKLLRPEGLIEHWPEWGAGLRSSPVLLNKLSGGRSNLSFLLNSDIGKLVLRINGTGSLLPGADRHSEIHIWQEASKQGLAPPLLFIAPQNQYLVSSYIKNELPSEPQVNSPFVEQAFTILERCHQLDIKAPTINYADHIEGYWHMIESLGKPPDPVLSQQRKPMLLLLESLLDSNTPTGLCHHDPVIANFIGTPQRLYLTDWEYAANGLQIMDYAALATEWALDDIVVLDRTPFEPESLVKARALYRYLCLLWENLND